MENTIIESVQTYTKQEIAELQLDRAICIFLDEQDFISAITLGVMVKSGVRASGGFPV